MNNCMRFVILTVVSWIVMCLGTLSYPRRLRCQWNFIFQTPCQCSTYVLCCCTCNFRNTYSRL